MTRLSLALLALLAAAFPVAASAQRTAAAAPPVAPRALVEDGERAWDAGDYPAALGHFRQVLAGPEAGAWRERIALLTGESWRTTEVARDARAPRWSPDGGWAAWEDAAASPARRRTTIARLQDGALVAAATVAGRGLVFSADGAEAAWIVGGDGQSGSLRVRVRVLASGDEREVAQGAATLAYGADRTLVAFRPEGGAVVAQRLSPGPVAPAVAVGAGSPVPVPGVPRGIDGGRQVVIGLADAGRAGGARPSVRWAVVDVRTLAARVVEGALPTASPDGSRLAWVRQPDAPGGSFTLMTASVADSAARALLATRDSLAAPAPADDGRVAYQRMPAFDWELYVLDPATGAERRVTREIQHDLQPRWLGGSRLSGLVGEVRHRRIQLYDLDSAVTRRRLFHNNTIRTIAPEYEWAWSPDATRLLVVAERDGDTVTPHRHLHLTDLGREVSIPELRQRIDAMDVAERALREQGRRMFAPIAARVRQATDAVDVGRVYAHEKALFDVDSKHVRQPGNRVAREYLLRQYRSFGLDARLQPFTVRPGAAPGDTAGITTANVLAFLEGTTHPELVYVVGSHFDSRTEGPGADDNTSGTAALLEAARVLASRPQPASILFVSFTGEEAGLLGSREFVRRSRDSLRVVGALNNDMLGWANDHRLDNTIRYSNPGIRDVQHAAALGFSRMITYDAFYYKGTDAQAMYDAWGDIIGGIGSYPVLGNPHYHQPHDALETINHQLVAEAAKTTAATLMLLASSPSRLTGLQVEAPAGADAVARWTPSPERDVARYEVRWGPPEAPTRFVATVRAPRARLAGARPGWPVSVRAVNRAGLAGWDWARGAVPTP